jgi:glycerol-3-phosphate dehydrogenase (NAD(P)+)
MKIGVIGSGSWGTALTKIITDNGHEVLWCVRSEKTAAHIRSRHHNPKYLSSVYFAPDHLTVTTDASAVYAYSDIVLIAVPSAYVLGYVEPHIDSILAGIPLVSAVKGMLPEQNQLLNQYLSTFSGYDQAGYVTIMGPCHAEEVAAEKLSYLTFAGQQQELVDNIAGLFGNAYVSTVSSKDVNGVQYAAILKNIYAVGIGIAHGLGYGDNFQSVFVANAAGEMTRLLHATGGASSSHVDYSASVYLGDLLVTCYSLFSRNRSFGNMIGKGYSVEATKLTMQMVAEGYPAAKSIHMLNQEAGAQMPIADCVYAILWEGADPSEAFSKLEKKLY